MDNHILNLNRKINFKIVKDIETKKNGLLDHALIGISPFNGYFSEENLTKLISWAITTFKDYTLFIPDSWSIFTLMGQGYSEQKAKRKTRKEDFRLKNRVIRSFLNNDISVETALNKILMATSLEKEPNYKKIHLKCIEKFNGDIKFRDICLSTSNFILSKTSENIMENDINTAVHYFLNELPLFLDAPKILGVSSSFCVYYNIPGFIEEIYQDSLRSPNQGFMVATVTE